MNSIFNNFDFLNNCSLGDLDVTKLLIILLLLTNKLDIEAIHIYRNDFIISLGNFYIQISSSFLGGS